MDREISLLQLLRGLNTADSEIFAGRNVILAFTAKDQLETRFYRDATSAIRALFEMEKSNPGCDIVLVRADTTEEVRIAFRNYFTDAREFIRMIEEGCEVLSGHSILLNASQQSSCT